MIAKHDAEVPDLALREHFKSMFGTELSIASVCTGAGTCL